MRINIFNLCWMTKRKNISCMSKLKISKVGNAKFVGLSMFPSLDLQLFISIKLQIFIIFISYFISSLYYSF